MLLQILSVTVVLTFLVLHMWICKSLLLIMVVGSVVWMMAKRPDLLVDVGLSQNCWIVILENIKPKHAEFFFKLMSVTYLHG